MRMQIVGAEPPSVEQIRERHERLVTRLRAAAEAGGHDPGGLRIVAVTKSWPVEVCRAALKAGLRILGESRVQEAEPKVDALPEAEWHLVGRLQSNKARRARAAFAVIHAVDSLGLLARLRAAAGGTSPRLLLQVNLSREASKAGFDAAWFDAESSRRGELAAAIGDAGLEVVGLMTIARIGATQEEARATFRELRERRDALREVTGRALPELSMGMSADAEAAAREGATLLRIGTALFGPRPA